MQRIFGALLLLGCIAAHAKPENVTEGEIALLPAYCADVQGFKYGDATYNTSPRAGYWVGLMGKSFWAMHHYCWALISLHRAQSPSMTAMYRMANYDSAIADMNYVIQNSTPDFVMLPEIYLRIGEVELLRKNPAGASAAFQKARELKPDYWPAYSRWADYLMKNGQRAQALELVRTGLQFAPKSEALLSQFRQLGGDPATLVPTVPTADAAASAAPQLPQ